MNKSTTTFQSLHLFLWLFWH